MTNRTTQFVSGLATEFSQTRWITPRLFWEWITDDGIWQRLLIGTSLLGVFVVFLAMVQFSTPNLAGNDGYYHIKLAYLMRTEGLKPAFDWLPLTILNADDFVDHHFLFHLLLIPFTFGDLRVGAKLASVLFPALSFLAVWWLLRSQRVRYSALWSLGLLAISEAFIYRMGMPRAQSLSLAVLVLAFHWLLTGRYRLLLPLGFLYVWLYNAFPLILVVAGLYTLAEWLINRQLKWQHLAFAAAGVGLGLVVNPYFPENLLFIYHHLAPKLLNPTEAARVGNEWFPYKTTQLMENSGLALLAMVGGMFALGMRSRRMDVKTATSLFLALFTAYLVFQSRRFIEYFPPFALIFAALACAPFFREWKETKMPAREPGRLPGIARVLSPLRRWLLAGFIISLLVIAVGKNLEASRASLQNSKPYERYAQASGWLRVNTMPGERIFQTDWDDFPRLFFYNSYNTYILGLDPTYMQIYDAELYDLWVGITKGKVEQPAQIIQETFGANYVITDLKHGGFLDEAEKDPGLVEVYRDEYAAIFQVVQNVERSFPP